MSWFLTIIVLSLALGNLSEAHGKKLPSAVVVGTVYCDTCFRSDFSTTSHFISGAVVAVECRGAGSKPSFREEVKTNEHGEFKVHLPFSLSKYVKRINHCSVKLISSSEPYCAVASTATSSSLRLKSRKQGTHIFSAGFFTFKPLKQPALCNQKPSDPSFPPPIQDPPTPFLPPIEHGHLPSLPPLPKLPPLPELPTLPPLPGLGVPICPPAVKNQLKSSKPANTKMVQQQLFRPLSPVPGIPLPPIPLDPPSVLPPNPFRPPPAVLPPIPIRPPPSVFPPNPVQPLPPLVNVPSVPGLAPLLPPPPPFSIPIPPFPFEPAPGFPGMPPAASSTNKISP
ncbi:hypothetical protein NMG60_11006293 [Bertholletia excelsa]